MDCEISKLFFISLDYLQVEDLEVARSIVKDPDNYLIKHILNWN